MEMDGDHPRCRKAWRPRWATCRPWRSRRCGGASRSSHICGVEVSHSGACSPWGGEFSVHDSRSEQVRLCDFFGLILDQLMIEQPVSQGKHAKVLPLDFPFARTGGHDRCHGMDPQMVWCESTVK